MKKLLTAMVAMTVLVGSVRGHEGGNGKQEARGRDIVQTGKTANLTGLLSTEGDEWQITVGETVYNLHLGPSFYREEKGIKLTAGTAASVGGFLDGADMAVCTIRIGDTQHVLRDENGRPAWAGRGRGNRSGNRSRSNQGACSASHGHSCAKGEAGICTKANKPVVAE